MTALKNFIIVPVHNRKDTTLACLEHLSSNGDLENFSVVIIDDGSTDETREAVEQAYPAVKVLLGDGNLWWTGAIAMGMDYVQQQGADYTIWLNDDCLPEPGTLDAMVQFMEEHPNTISSPACLASVNSRSNREHTGFKDRQGCTAQVGEVVYVDGLAGRCVGFPAAVVNTIGLPDARKFPHYGGDDMYTYRATQAGFKACIMGDATAILVGPVQDTLDFQWFFQSKKSPAETFRAIFWDKKSPYRLHTKFFVFTEKYGLIPGTFAFVMKASMWLWQWLKLQLNVSLLSHRSS